MLSSNREYDSYWRLEAYQHKGKQYLTSLLQKHGYTPKHYDSINDLVKHLQRLDSGYILYENENIPKQDLVKFVERRGLTMPKTKTRKALAATLYEADQNRTFHRFEQLPPELRVRVYGFYVKALNQGGIALKFPTQPPATRTNRLARQEALPVFYENSRFQINFVNHRKSEETIPKFRPCLYTSTFLATIPAQHDGFLREIKLSFGSVNNWEVRAGRMEDEKTFSIRLNITADQFEIESGDRAKQFNFHSRTLFLHADARSVEQALRGVLTTICGSGGVKKLGYAELSALRTAAEGAYFGSQ